MTDEQRLDYLRRKTADESELWAADRIEELERQLAVRDKQIVMLREAIDRQPYTMDKQVCEALAATDCLDGLILCEKEPVAYKYTNAYVDVDYLTWKQSPGGRDWVPLHRARRPE